MGRIFNTITANWSTILIPIVVVIVSIIALFWLRRLALIHLERWTDRMKWPKDNFLIQSIKQPSSILCLILSAYIGLQVSVIPDNWKNPASNLLWTLFILALTILLLSLVHRVSIYYGRKYNLPRRVVLITRNVMRIIIVVIAVLAAMAVWGVPTSPLILLIAVAIIIAILAFRDSVPNLLASFQIAATREYKVGDYIKLDSGEEGYITNVSWDKTSVKGLDNSTISVPNQSLISKKVINYGRPLKRAKRPFLFNTRVYLPELTGLKARNLSELAAILKSVPDTVIYYHTHHFLEEHQYLIPELNNDFASWVKNSLDNQVLGERLANISINDFDSLGAFRDKVVNVIETYQAQNLNRRDALEGREFYFIKSVDVILPTAYSAGDLREFVEALRKVTPGSIYFHVYASRLRLKNYTNDFVVWLADAMEEKDLSQVIAKIDPYTFTLEGLRSLLIQTIEKHIK
jgi:small-conductance mechanosensitive channel